MININSFKVENFSDPYIIAEIGANHNGDMELAKKMIDSAFACGANAVKFQSWTNESLISKSEFENNQKYDDSVKKHFGSLEEMVNKYYLRSEQHYELKRYCDTVGIEFCSTAFSEAEVDLLEDVGVPFHKVASMDINNLRLLRKMSKTNKPILLSTGMATLCEIDRAIKTIEHEGNDKIVILHCISIYPPKYEDINLNNIKMLQSMYPMYPIGFSDHSIGSSIPLSSVSLGCAVIEKHFTIDKDLPGWDHEISSDPMELKMIVTESKNICKAIGSYTRIVSDDEEAKKIKFRRSIVLSRDMKIGEIISAEDISFKRPGTGIAPDLEEFIIGRKINKAKDCDELLSWEDII